MDMEQLQAALIDAEKAYVEHTGNRPYCGLPPFLRLEQSSEWKAKIYTHMNGEVVGHGTTPEGAIARLKEQILATPTGEEANLREFQKDLAKLIDKGRDLGIDVDFVNPLSETAKKLAERALTYEAQA